MVTAIGTATDGKSYSRAVTGMKPVSAPGEIADTTKSNPKVAKDINIDISGILTQKNAVDEKGNVQGIATAAAEAEKEDLEKAAEELSSVVQSMGANLAFAVHEGTNRLMVRMVDAEGTILKEYPSAEFLDMVTRIRDYIGNLLDKKA